MYIHAKVFLKIKLFKFDVFSIILTNSWRYVTLSELRKEYFVQINIYTVVTVIKDSGSKLQFNDSVVEHIFMYIAILFCSHCFFFLRNLSMINALCKDIITLWLWRCYLERNIHKLSPVLCKWIRTTFAPWICISFVVHIDLHVY